MITVVLFEDNPQLREGLAMLIGGTDGYKVLAAFKDCSNLVEDLHDDVGSTLSTISILST